MFNQIVILKSKVKSYHTFFENHGSFLIIYLQTIPFNTYNNIEQVYDRIVCFGP